MNAAESARLVHWTQMRACSVCKRYRARRVNSLTFEVEPFVCTICARDRAALDVVEDPS